MLDIKSKKQIIKYVCISVFFLIFGLIYESFSHGVYSVYMMYAFIIPLLLGVFVYVVLYLTKFNLYVSEFGMQIYNSSIISLTLGSIMKGVLEIYGTTNNLIIYYLIISIILIILSIVINVISVKKNK